MRSFTNHTAGARGINVKPKGSSEDTLATTRWVEPGETLDLDDGEEVYGTLPDLGKPAGDADKSGDRISELEAALTASEARVAELEATKSDPAPWMIAAAVGQLDNANADHWTAGGEPKVEAVATLLGSDVSRADIKAAAPDAKRVTE